MNRVVTTDASITAGQPIVANNGLGTLPFIQDSFQEAMANFVKGVLGTYTTNDLIVLIDPLIVISGGGSNTATWTAGAIFYNNEIYTIAAGTITKAGGAVFLYVISDTASPVLDPVNFKDGTTHSPHRVRQITISSGTTGTGIADYGAATVKALQQWNNGNDTTGFSFISPSPMTINSFVYQWRVSGNSIYFEFTLNITAGNTATPLSLIASLPFNKKQKATNQPEHNLTATQNGTLIYAKAISSNSSATNKFLIQSPVAVTNGDVFVFTGAFIVEI
jgi:hypothetical protein